MIQKIQPYIDNEDFQPAAIAKVNLNRVLEVIKLFLKHVYTASLLCDVLFSVIFF